MSGGGRWRALLAVAGVGAFVVPFYLSVYVLNTFETPIGWDVPKYLWRTSLASEVGVTGLPSRVPPPVNASPDRPGYPVVALSLERLVPSPGGVEGDLLLAAALPMVGLAALGLAAGALIVVGFGRPWWQGAVGAAFVGTSSVAVRLAGPEGYLDNILAGAVLLAALMLLVERTRRAGLVSARSAVAPTLLLVAGAAIHWAFFGVVWLSVAGAVVWRRRGWFSRYAEGRGRAVVTVLLLSVVGAALVSLALGAWPNPPVVHEGEFSRKLTDTLERLDLLLISLALVGLVVTGRRRTLPGRPWESFTQDVLFVWLGGSLLTVILKMAGLPIPAHRLVAFALPLPIFAFLGAVAIGEAAAARLGRGGERTRPRWVPVVAIVLLGASSYLALDTWTEVQPAMEPTKVQDAAAVEFYLDLAEVPTSKPVVFVVEDLGGNPDFTIPLMAHTFRTQLDPQRIPDTYIYVGDPEVYLEGRVDVLRLDGSERRDGVAWRFMRDLRSVIDDEPVAIITRSYNAEHYQGWTTAHPASVFGGGVAIVAGPEGHLAFTGGRGRALDPILMGLGAVTLGIALLIVGAAWMVAQGDRVGWFSSLAVAPAVGIAAVVVVGLVADLLLGQPLGGRVTVPGAVVLGVGASWLWRRRTKATA